MSEIVIFGAGDIARLAHFYFRTDSNYKVVAFVVDREYRKENSFLGLPVIDSEDLASKYPSSKFKMFIALSYVEMNQVRAKKYELMKGLGYELVSYISSKCTFLSETAAGDNCLILEDNTIQPFVKLGNNVTLWSGNHIGHDSVIGDHCFITSHVVVSGHVHINPYCFIGVNATLRNSITIAESTLIGAGSIIMKDTVEKGVYLPERAKLFDKKSDEVSL
jgi:sugar O-acyltransferase (sialic acid O-acetyltransferase NeuD family)